MEIFIAIAQGILVAIMGYMGIHVTLHPQENPRKRRAWKSGFALVGILSVSLIGWQALLAQESASALNGAISREGEETRLAIKEQGQRPIQINMPQSKSPSAPKIQPENKKITLRNKAVELSAEVLSFLGERNRTGLQNFNLQNTGFGKDVPIADSQKSWDAEVKRVDAYQRETINLYNTEFRERARYLLAEMKVAGIDVDRAWYIPGDPAAIQKFATDLAAVARDIR